TLPPARGRGGTWDTAPAVSPPAAGHRIKNKSEAGSGSSADGGRRRGPSRRRSIRAWDTNHRTTSRARGPSAGRFAHPRTPGDRPRATARETASLPRDAASARRGHHPAAHFLDRDESPAWHAIALHRHTRRSADPAPPPLKAQL